jgi:hypothetical protein
MKKSILFLHLLLEVFQANAFIAGNQRRWNNVRQFISTSSTPSATLQMSLTAGEINSRLEKQLEKLKAKDATSKAITKEVNIYIYKSCLH